MNPSLLATIPELAPDVQAGQDHRGVAIERVGIRGLRYPILLATAAGEQASIAQWELTVELEAERRGTHMSRLVETLEHWSSHAMTGRRLLSMLADLRERLEAPRSHARCETTMFIERAAPISGLSAQHAIDCSFDAASDADHHDLQMGVRVPITTLCPCSKEISEYGAHNQRGYVTLRAGVRADREVSFLDLLAIAEDSGSAPIYPLLKRVDERHVTMQAYDAPTFVEDVVRNAAVGLAADERITNFTIEAENQESIHDHAAVATVRWERT